MNYGQFIYMFPECALVVALILVFAVDFAMTKTGEWRGEKPNVAIGRLTCLMLMTVGLGVFSAMRQGDTITAFGGMYVATQTINVMKMVLTFGTFIVVIMAESWTAKQQRIAGEFYMLILSTLLGMFMMMSSGSFLLFFLGLEMASVPLACMVAFDRHRKESAEGAAKYILVATFSSGVMLFGISFIYAATGTLYFDDVCAAVSNSPLCIMGLVFFFSGLGFKISLVPFHFWTADTYQGAPTPVTGYLSVISKGAAAITLCTILMKAFAPMVEYWDYMLYIVIVLSITVANLFAIRQNELKRFMAFSSISQAGYIMLAVVGNGQLGVAALTYYVLVYIVANMAVFTVINVVEQNNNGRTDMAAYNGFYQTNPKLSFLMTLALFSLAGIPPFAGMFSKFFVFMAGVQNGEPMAYGVVFIALVNTVVSLYYYLLIVKAMYITKTENPLPTFQSDEATKLALGICTAGIALFGVASCVYEWIAAAGI
ncbi:NADH-quinone oxidoreductase subunit N [Xylanibacter ruminicola]|uniref:NADH-quinone oxidoreductase subunit N n=1 Tax=Xylanibacter ruminicola TaxID=839 RepID=A0A1M7FXW9_XYLRU|nr:NADH-quinone oxidoreductase subunit N [Xylanibacter ruminicola]SFC62690.1 NADH-quinone oxidoreductase subunit N [Xylanibacter ruminicola]SHM08668.1 NADH-quinone oxidoreductase subunit N [Xylanibacter ruminicola]